MWINPDFVKAHRLECPHIEERLLLGRIKSALSDPREIMEIDWSTLHRVTDIPVAVWDRVYDTEDWYYDDETLEAMYALEGLIRPLPPQVPLESYL